MSYLPEAQEAITATRPPTKLSVVALFWWSTTALREMAEQAGDLLQRLAGRSVDCEMCLAAAKGRGHRRIMASNSNLVKEGRLTDGRHPDRGGA